LWQQKVLPGAFRYSLGCLVRQIEHRIISGFF
jgi:hypothetical protein